MTVHRLGGVPAPAALPAWCLALVPVLGVAAWAASAGADVSRLAALLVLAPLLEETAFRAGVHEALLRRGLEPRLAIGLVAIAFACAHALLRLDPRALAVALPAWAIGVVYQRRRRVRDCVALHALFNAAWIAWMLIAAGSGPA